VIPHLLRVYNNFRYKVAMVIEDNFIHVGDVLLSLIVAGTVTSKTN